MKKNNFYTVRGYMIKDDNPLTPTMEDYLEMIYRLCEEEGYARMKDLSEQLHVKASSSTKIVQKLAVHKFVYYEKYGIIQLTKKGKEYGGFLLYRHEVIEEFLKKLDIKETLLRDTELIEHHISPKLLNEVKYLNDFFEVYPNVLQSFNSYKKEINEKK
ncbi:MAG: iron dependent repressor, metal binding and dimerization domain protein [Eubacteriales bacterium]